MNEQAPIFAMESSIGLGPGVQWNTLLVDTIMVNAYILKALFWKIRLREK